MNATPQQLAIDIFAEFVRAAGDETLVKSAASHAHDVARILSAGDQAILALSLFAQAGVLGDFIYEIRERECQGWFGPKVSAWSLASLLAQRAIA